MSGIWNRLAAIAIATTLAFTLVGCGEQSADVAVQPASNETDKSVELPAGVDQQAYAEAEAWFRQSYPELAPSREAIMLVLAERAAQAENFQQGVDCYRQIATSVPRLGLTARLEEGKLLIQLGEADRAEAALREFIEAARVAAELQPTQVLDAFKWLTYLLSVQIRQEERRELLLEQHQLGLADPLDSKQMYFPNLLILNSPAGRKRLSEFLERDPSNPTLQAAAARYLTFEGKFDEARQMLEAMQAAKPNDLRIAAALAECYFELADSEGLNRVIDSMPEYAADEPWLLTRMRGERAIEAEAWQQALEYFEIVLKADPANAPAQMGCAKAWGALGNKEKQSESLIRSNVLAEIRVNLSSVQPSAVAASEELAEKCRAIGMDSAAATFDRHARVIAQQLAEAEANGASEEGPPGSAPGSASQN